MEWSRLYQKKKFKQVVVLSATTEGSFSATSWTMTTNNNDVARTEQVYYKITTMCGIKERRSSARSEHGPVCHLPAIVGLSSLHCYHVVTALRCHDVHDGHDEEDQVPSKNDSGRKVQGESPAEAHRVKFVPSNAQNANPNMRD